MDDAEPRQLGCAAGALEAAHSGARLGNLFSSVAIGRIRCAYRVMLLAAPCQRERSNGRAECAGKYFRVVMRRCARTGSERTGDPLLRRSKPVTLWARRSAWGASDGLRPVHPMRTLPIDVDRPSPASNASSARGLGPRRGRRRSITQCRRRDDYGEDSSVWPVQHPTVRLADFPYGFGRILREACSGIRTEQCQCLLLAERVPEVFKPHRGSAMALRPQERHHFSEGPNTPGTAGTRTV